MTKWTTSSARLSAWALASALACDAGIEKAVDDRPDYPDAKADAKAPEDLRDWAQDAPDPRPEGDESSSSSSSTSGEGEVGGAGDSSGDGGDLEELGTPVPTSKKKKKIRFPKSGGPKKEDPFMNHDPVEQQKQIYNDLEQVDEKLDDVLKGLDGL